MTYIEETEDVTVAEILGFLTMLQAGDYPPCEFLGLDDGSMDARCDHDA